MHLRPEIEAFRARKIVVMRDEIALIPDWTATKPDGSAAKQTHLRLSGLLERLSRLRLHLSGK